MNRLRINTQAHADPLVARTGAILKDRLQQRGVTVAAELKDNAIVMLSIDGGLQADAYHIEQAGHSITIAGGTPQGLLYGVGKFLRTSGYDGTFQPSSWQGTSVPQGSLRGMYFASHFHNWYHVAPEEELRRYVEDLALWGGECPEDRVPLPQPDRVGRSRSRRVGRNGSKVHPHGP